MITKKILWLVILTVLLAACASGPSAQEKTATSAVQTQAAASPTLTSTAGPTRTPRPTRTAYASRTPIPSPTKTPLPNLTSTIEALLTQSVEMKANEVKASLEQVGLVNVTGDLGWFSDIPIEAIIDAGQKLVPMFLDIGEYSDFALQTDVTWDTSGGFAGCGVIFLAEEDLSQGGQYRFYTQRLSGKPTWSVEFWQFGKQQSVAFDEAQTSTAIKVDQGSTNRYLLIKRNRLMTVYANDVRLGTVDITRRSQGFFYLFAYQDARKTKCTFNNTWIWKFGE